MSVDFDDAWERARDEPAFSNGTEWECWEAQWCDRCDRDAAFRAGRSNLGCPLLIVALSERTPAQWVEQPWDEHGPPLADRYHCTDFRRPGWRDPEPRPMPEPPDMDGLFERPDRGVRMLTQAPAVELVAPRVVTVPATAGVL